MARPTSSCDVRATFRAAGLRARRRRSRRLLAVAVFFLAGAVWLIWSIRNG